MPLVVACGLLVQLSAQDDRPLPEAASFFEAVRANMARAQREQNRYAYRERRTELHTNPFGRLGTDGVRVIEVIPAADGRTAMRRVLERNSRPVESPAEQITLPQPRPGTGVSRNVDDIVRTLDFAIVRREMVGRHASIVVSFTPKPGAKPETRQGKMVKAFKGYLWIHEEAQEVERVEAVAVEDLSYGLGVIARINEGAEVTAERRPVEGGVWMPTALRFNGQGRAILFRKLDVDYAIDWFDYRLVGTARSPTP
jgi:hypothetical protein